MFFWSWVGIGASNFIYAYLSDSVDFERAFERTFFQGVALLATWLAMKFA